MTFPRRLGAAFSSIVLPSGSIYADLDGSPDALQQRVHLSPVTPTLASPSPQSPQTAADEDPFSAVTPSVLSPASARGGQRQLEPDPPSSSPRLSPAHHAHGRLAVAAHDPSEDFQSPFHPSPIPNSPSASRSHSLSPTPTSSVYLPAHSNPTASNRSPPSSVSTTSRERPGGVGLGMSASRSGIGNRSLMGLLGGTRYEGGGFPFGGVGVGEEDEEDLEDHGQAGGHRMDDASLAASLPPPPSAMSSNSSTTSREDDEDDDAPPDFTSRIPLVSSTHAHATSRRRPPRVAHPSSTASDAGLHLGHDRRQGPLGGILGGGRRAAFGMSAKERALWRWVNVEDLDGFLHQVYLYYVGKGIWAIGLERILNLLTVGWVIGFSTFLMGCIDYPRLWHSNHLSDVVVPKCVSRLSGFTLLLFISFAAFYAWRIVRFSLGVRRLWEMHEFYTELLEVPENDIQTIPWHAIVARLSALRATHPSALSLSSGPNPNPSERLDAHDVANRIMREENYLIALFNKDVLDISLPLPTAVARVVRKRRFGKSMLTQTLEWNLSFCLVGFLFGQDGQVRRAFLSERNKTELVEALKRRFILMGLINAVFAPFIVLYLLMYSFFRYFEEYHKNPSSIGSRQFTPLARWKFREFNELSHLFQQRLALAHPLADQYINQYPKAKTALISRFVAFLAGSFAAVLILFSLIDPDAFLHFEITPGRTVLFYIGVFGTVLAAARGMVPDENRVIDPEELMKGIIEHTHYVPVEWRGKLHSADVYVAFGKLFQTKVSLFLQEIFSVLLTPFVLWYTLPNCAGPIVDFFREFTVHVDGLGYVCSFAVFDFKRHGDTRFGAPVQVQEERWKSTEGKMEKSFLTFAASNPAWVPRDQTQSLFLSKMTDAPAASTLHPPPHASFHQPNSRHPSSSTALHPHHHTRATSRGSRFAPLAEAEEATPDARTRAEKARMYDRAFQHSALLSSANLAGPDSSRPLSGPSRLHAHAQQHHARKEQLAIDEESTLDGDSFVAPTDAQPFGLLPRGDGGDGDEDDPGTIPDESTAKLGRAGLGGLVSELYRR
ncbi:hypothetical protein JCM5296_001302 [Sporobolomyces johnsonii]